jgi:hypothetical protein
MFLSIFRPCRLHHKVSLPSSLGFGSRWQDTDLLDRSARAVCLSAFGGPACSFNRLHPQDLPITSPKAIGSLWRERAPWRSPVSCIMHAERVTGELTFSAMPTGICSVEPPFLEWLRAHGPFVIGSFACSCRLELPTDAWHLRYGANRWGGDAVNRPRGSWSPRFPARLIRRIQASPGIQSAAGHSTAQTAKY